MRGKRKLRKVEGMSTEVTHIYECDSCAWTLDVPAALDTAKIEAEFTGHDCKENALKKCPPSTSR
jgi:hypothetical protein